MTFTQKLRWGFVAAVMILAPIEVAHGAAIFTNSALFKDPTVIDFEPDGSGNTLTEINNYLHGLSPGTTLAIGGAGARIDDLRDSDRSFPFRVNHGADGGPTSGAWGFEGGVLGESWATLTFAPGQFQEAVGTFWGGVVSPNARTVATFADGSTFTAFVQDSLPLVPDSAPDTAGINGFLGIDGQGQLIQQVSFFNNNDLYSQDDVMFGPLRAVSTSVPEPASTFALLIMVLGLILWLNRDASSTVC